MFRRRPVGGVATAARVVVQRTPETLTLVRRRAQPTAATTARLVGTPVFAYVLALQVPGSSRPVVAPLTALLVVQVTLYQTIRSAIRRVASVVAGVLVAVALSAAVGFTWWSLGITIAASLVLGNLLHLGREILEVPISAMLILSVDVRVAATNRIIETLLGAGAGLLSGFILAAPRVQPAEEAVDDLCRQMADLLDQMAQGLADGTAPEASGAWLERARALGGEIRRVDSALRQAEESVRLYPLKLLLPGARISLQRTLGILEHAALTVRGLARTVADSFRLEADDSPLRDTGIQSSLAAVLRELAEAARIYGRLARAHDTGGVERLESDLNRHLTAARERQDQLSALLGTDPATRPVGWPLRGELLSHLDRLRKELQAGGRIGLPRRRRLRSWRRPAQAGRRQPRSPTRHRVKALLGAELAAARAAMGGYPVPVTWTRQAGGQQGLAGLRMCERRRATTLGCVGTQRQDARYGNAAGPPKRAEHYRHSAVR